MPTAHQTNIFVSSVYQELIPYRKAALDAVWRCDLYPLGMEREDVAKPFSTSKSSRRMVDEAAVYVGIFSHRYGVVTAEELQWAQERGIPVLPFIATERLNDQDQESDPEHARLLEELKRELRDQYTVAPFATPEELGVRVYRSLVALREDGKLPQPERVTPFGRDVAVIPTPPQPYYAHPYLLGGSGFVGRRTELAQLDAWAGSASEPLLVVDAIGGAGKSALAWDWVQTHLDATLPERAGVIWWSFYESNATMGNFLAHAHAYLSRHDAEESARRPRPEEEAQLLAQLTQRPVVLVLDGLERLLLAYRRLDASRVADAAVEAQPRGCIDPRDGAFLRALTRCNASKILITSRLLPTDLQDHSGQLLPGIRHLPLSGLTPDDAIDLMERTGVEGGHALMRTLLSQFGDHALLVQVLAGRIRAYRPAPGNFDRWYEAEGQHLQLDAHDLTARQVSVLDAALADLDPSVFRFLCQLAAFRYPVDYAALIALNPFTQPLRGEAVPPSRPHQGGGEEELVRSESEAKLGRLHRALAELEERGLVQWDRGNNRYDLHPVVRNVAYGHLEDKPATLVQMRSYFEALPTETRDQVQDVADLRRTLELYHTLVESGLLDEAFRLYKARAGLGSILYFDLGAYTTMVELLTPLFPLGLAEPPALRSANYQSYATGDLALAFRSLGEWAQAKALFGVALDLDLRQHHSTSLVVNLVNLSQTFRLEGRYLVTAERALQLGREVALVAADQKRLDGTHRDLTLVYADIGAWSAGEVAYAALLASHDKDVQGNPFVPLAGARLQFGQGKDSAGLIEEALRRTQSERYASAEREAHRLRGEVALSRGDLAQTEESWQAAYTVAQRQAQPLGPYLADLARLRARQGKADLARELIAEALASGGVHVALAAAEVYLALGDTAEATRQIYPAHEQAWAEGPPYAFVLDLARARAVLKALTLSEPQLPPFDPSKVPPVPYEAEIRAFIAELQGDPKANSRRRRWWAPWTWGRQRGTRVDSQIPVELLMQ